MNQIISEQCGKHRHVSKNTITISRWTKGGASKSVPRYLGEMVAKLEDKETTKTAYSRKATFWDKLSRFFGGKK
jgi:hypothetical protein